MADRQQDFHADRGRGQTDSEDLRCRGNCRTAGLPELLCALYGSFRSTGKAVRKQSDVPLVHPDGTRTVKGGRGAAASDGSGKQLYYYINHELQTLFAAYNKGEWNRLEKLGDMSSALYKEKESIIEGLPSFTGTMVKEYFSCIDFKKEEEKAVCYVKDKEQLKKAFLQFMMPFYPYYYKQLSEGGLRHTALLQPNTLRLFQQLTGKKFRPGYRNRYTTGVRAFEWDKNRYKVYGKDGKLLCDAIFGTDGIIEGYGQKKYTDETHPDWNIVEEGNWENGTFEGGILRYEYKKPVE